MNCLDCTSKNCKLKQQDCTGERDQVIASYDKVDRAVYADADALVSGGKAGSLSRVQELVEFMRSQEYVSVGIAYCFSMEQEAKRLKDILENVGTDVQSFRCTINGISESSIVCGLSSSVGCNPAGQARAVNESTVDLVIEMGLCLGHDILFHKHLEKPFTVLAVKDRVYGHNPLKGLDNFC